MNQNDIVLKEIDNLINEAKKFDFTDDKIDKIRKAAIFGMKKHDGQFRKSGEPYILHPLEVSKILMHWHMDLDTIITGILHDVLEDTHTTEQELKDEFGVDILNLIKYVTKISLLSKENRQSLQKSEIENNYVVQVFLSMSQDIRGMIVKLADRYHNMMTIKYLKPEKQFKIASETMNIYSKVAGRLGMYRLKSELQDLSFEIINNEAYNNIKNQMNNIIIDNNPNWTSIIEQIKSILTSNSVKFEIKERMKSIYSTWQKVEKGYNIKNIHDIYAIRIVVNEDLDCYKVLGLLHLNFNFVKNAFKDYISNPKLNFYQSIHTTIIKNQTLLEVQVRTKKMDITAEHGIAAHWIYKEHINDINALTQSFNLINEVSNLTSTNFETIKQITNDVVFDVFVMNNDKKYVVNNRSRAIDIAYRTNQENFKYLSSVIVNGQKVNIDTPLKPNDVVLFNYSNKIQIRKQWLKFTYFNTTQDGIKKIIDQQIKEHFTKEKFFQKLENNLKNNYIGNKKTINLISKNFYIKNIETFLEQISNELYNDPLLIECFDKRKNISKNAIEEIKKKYVNILKEKKDIYFNNMDGIYFLDLQFPFCCNKVPKMDVIGKMNKKNILEVHNVNCSQIKKIHNKLHHLTWDDENLRNRPRRFRYKIDFVADWLPSIGNVITKQIMYYNIIINYINIEKNKNNGQCNVKIVMYVNDLKQVKAWVSNLAQEINIKTNLDFN